MAGSRHTATAAALALLGGALLLLGAASAHASDSLTVNTTSAYVDPSVTAEFVTVPNLCLEPYGDQGTTTGCDELGERAVTAYQGTSTDGDVYWEPGGSFLQATNAFVPQNPGAIFAPTGYSPLFSQHKYDLFGRAEDRMGPLTRIELLFLQEMGVVSGSAVSGQTIPGSDDLFDYFTALLVLPASQTAYSPGGTIVFDIADLATYVRVTGLDHGGQAVVSAWCDGYFGAAVCSLLGPVNRAINYIYLSGQVDVAIPTACTSGGLGGDIPDPANCNAREQWMDQTVVSYAEAWESLGGDDHFAQNFRSQVGYDPRFATLTASTQVVTDFRLEQSVELSGAFTSEGSDPGDTITPGDNVDGLAGRQTFQQAFAGLSGPGSGGLLGSGSIGQMVSQDVQGYLMTCLNCEEPGASHAFQPAKQNLALMPYQSGWNVVPTVVHGGQ